MQSLAHPRADGEADPALWSAWAFLIPQPIHQVLFVTGRITAVVIFPHRARQGRKRCLGNVQGRHHRRHIAVAKFVRQHQPGLRPHRQHRLITPLAFIGGLRLPLVAGDNRGVLIDCGHPLVGTALPAALHQIAIHPPQPFQGPCLFGNIGDFARQAPLLCFLDLRLLVKRIQKLQRRSRRGQRVAQHLRQTGIFAQALKILRTFAPGSVENYEALHERGLVVAALPLLHAHLVLHTLRQPQRAEGLHHQRDSSQRRQGFFKGLGVNFEQQGRLGRGRFGLFAHRCTLLAIPHPTGEQTEPDCFPETGYRRPSLQPSARLCHCQPQVTRALSTD